MEKVVFTNGCFDVLHPGHVFLLEKARAMGTKLIVGINSDASVKSIKGESRPIVSQTDRAAVLKGLRCVDEVYIFEENTPENLIKKIKPDVLVKGGDWLTEEIIGADFVEKNGGRVFSIPLKKGYSSTTIVDKIREPKETDKNKTSDDSGLIGNSIVQHIEVFQKILRTQIPAIEEFARIIIEALGAGNKILFCGNGGSASDAQHLAAEFVGRYETERRALPAIALTTDTSALTAVANDYGFERVFSRQVEALGNSGDILIAISTSGNSPNVNAAVMAARRLGLKTLGLTGVGGKKLASLCDFSIMIPAERTARIQEAHIAVGHIVCELVDKNFAARLSVDINPG